MMARLSSPASATASAAATRAGAGAGTNPGVTGFTIRGGGAGGTGKAADDHAGRMDSGRVGGAGPRGTDAAFGGEGGSRGDSLDMPWPSDHRVMVAAARL